MAELVNLFTDEGEIVMDPFAGSGTTMVAACMAGRSAIGFELGATHYATALRRLRGESARANPAQPDLFGSVTP